MVKVREDRPLGSDGKLDVVKWATGITELSKISDTTVEVLRDACLTSQSLEFDRSELDSGWAGGVTSFLAGLEMAEILADLQMDQDTLVAAVLYRAAREGKISRADIEKQFGSTVARLVEGVKRMAAISGLTNHKESSALGQELEAQAENIRKMLVAMVDDVRIALIKLAERTCAIRAVKEAPLERRRYVAVEVADIYAPLAHRLGIGHIKWELEDLAFRYLHPFDYKYIAKLLDERRLDRQTYIAEVISILEHSLAEGQINGQVYGRAKHIYSIWRKMRKKNIGFSEVYDIRAVRILVNTERECYTVLGIVHALWRNISHEFDDYIANPKENGYRSLHTAVHGPANRVLEIQIRTLAMHEEAEFGVCAHWHYKDTDSRSNETSYEQKIAWLRQVLEWHDDVGGSPWDDHLPRGIEQDRIYVFTPDGHVIDLPDRATPVDFAFRVHSDVGICCRGAKVNGRIVPLNYELQTADQVEVLTGKRSSPSRDWLNPNLGYIRTARARSRLQQWFKEQDRDQNIADGRALLDHEFKRLAVEGLDYEKLTQKLHLKSLDDLYAAVGTADLSVDRVINASQRLISIDKPEEPATNSLVGRALDEKSGVDVYINGVGNLMSHIAQCCRPLPGDEITGYITLGRGVSIHRRDCANIFQRQSTEPERIIAVDWAEKPDNFYSVPISIEAFDRHGLLRDIATLLDRERVNVSAMQTLSNKSKNTVDMTVTLEIADLSALSRILAKLNHLPNISSVRRQG